MVAVRSCCSPRRWSRQSLARTKRRVKAKLKKAQKSSLSHHLYMASLGTELTDFLMRGNQVLQFARLLGVVVLLLLVRLIGFHVEIVVALIGHFDERPKWMLHLGIQHVLGRLHGNVRCLGTAQGTFNVVLQHLVIGGFGGVVGIDHEPISNIHAGYFAALPIFESITKVLCETFAWMQRPTAVWIAPESIAAIIGVQFHARCAVIIVQDNIQLPLRLYSSIFAGNNNLSMHKLNIFLGVVLEGDCAIVRLRIMGIGHNLDAMDFGSNALLFARRRLPPHGAAQQQRRYGEF